MRTALLTAAVLGLALTGCATADPGVGPSDTGSVDIRGEWMLVAGAVDGESIELSPFPFTMEFIGDNARVRTGCFAFDQPLSTDIDVMTLASFSQPTADCMGPTAGEQAAIESLARLTGAERNGDSLTLIGETVELDFELVAPVELGAIAGQWALDSVIMGDVSTGLSEGATLVVDADGTVSGSTGCATFTGTLGEIVSGTNYLSDLEIASADCTDVSSTPDAEVRTVLEGGFLIHSSDGQLSLISSEQERTLMYSPVA